MKITDLVPAKQELLKAFVEGEVIQVYIPESGWVDTNASNFFSAIGMCHKDWLRVKSKELVVTCKYNAISSEGMLLSFDSNSIQAIKEYYSNSKISYFIKRTFHDGVFIRAEIVN